VSLQSRMSDLGRVPMFSSLSDAELEVLARRSVEKRYSAGDVLFYEGDDCDGIYILTEGRVKIFKISPSGREMTIAIEQAPGTVAELPLFDGGPYPASVAALTDVTALLLYKRDFQQVCRQFPEVSLKMLAVVGKRLRHLVATLESVTFGSVRQRLAKTLLEFGQESGGGPFALPLTHQELASRLGTVREVVSRNLSRFQAEGLIRMAERQIVITDREGLEREAATEL
jgi:CRP-like cAMP-binding protein